jgi:hypothetical protein
MIINNWGPSFATTQHRWTPPIFARQPCPPRQPSIAAAHGMVPTRPTGTRPRPRTGCAHGGVPWPIQRNRTTWSAGMPLQVVGFVPNRGDWLVCVGLVVLCCVIGILHFGRIRHVVLSPLLAVACALRHAHSHLCLSTRSRSPVFLNATSRYRITRLRLPSSPLAPAPLVQGQLPTR